MQKFGNLAFGLYNCCMQIFKREFPAGKFLIGLLLTGSIAAAGAQPSHAAEAEKGYLVQQLSGMARFENLQSGSEPAAPKTAEIINGFIAATEDQAADEEIMADHLAAFTRLAFMADSEDNINFSGLLRVLQISGRMQFQKDDAADIGSPEKHFSGHVKEAIKVNRERAKFYADLSNGKTKGLSKLYTSMEYALLPVSAIFDRWGRRLSQQGIPVLANDFVPMSAIKPAATKPINTRALDRDGRKAFRKLLDAFQSRVFAVASRKDFLQVQMAAIEALTGLRQLEARYACNLALSVHFVESIGLAGRNADNLSRSFAGRPDNFYRAFIVAQNAGVKMFSLIDLKAQPFHGQGVGIIVNDLPAIPFP